ncbi:hypothetical protein [Paenibacillus sp. Soil522]|uniref:hypothetical protein n=1 Tax=Paenibacillus sp. Soil522 TaxID=1736388 RepID=UPI0006FAE6A4|nr:hypothetical protein [Paenibacillus sp. Soil522]KRE47884.1 hypothetical protein ASG81_08200 [Paenibacillus sp. Soil522]
MKAYITANEGFISAELIVEQAVIYARLLRQLGNVDVRVVPINALKTGKSGKQANMRHLSVK